MAHQQHYTKQQKTPHSTIYTSRSSLDRTTTTTTTTTTTPPTSRYFPSFSLDPTSTWPSSFNFSSALTKRPSEALYNHFPMGAHMLGQSEAWLTSDSLAKRPRLEFASNLPVYPQRPGEKDCSHYMLTRTCRFGDSCKFDHPIWVPAGGIPDWKELPPVPFDTHPERPGEPDCPYFLKTKSCKFGLNCKFNHQTDKLSTSGKTDTPQLPERPSEPICSFYAKTGKCKFGPSCKFHHPKDIQISSAVKDAGKKQHTNSTGTVGNLTDGNAVKALIPVPPSSFNSKGLPMRLGEVDCPFYMKSGSCKYGANCRYNHPDMNDLFPSLSVMHPPAAAVGSSVFSSPIANLGVGIINPAASMFQSLQPSLSQTMAGPVAVLYPQRPGQNECEYYMKSGVCKFGDRCRFHHPIDRQERSVKLSLAGLPRREGVTNCPFYMKTGMCKYGATCKFDHPPPGEVMAASEKEKSTTAEDEEKEEVGENHSE